MSAPESPERNVGTFATGQDDPEAHPDDTDIGSFADNDEELEKVS